MSWSKTGKEDGFDPISIKNIVRSMTRLTKKIINVLRGLTKSKKGLTRSRRLKKRYKKDERKK